MNTIDRISYQTQLDIKQLKKEAKAYWRTIDNMRKKDEEERKKILIRCSIILEQNLFAGAC